MSIFELMDYQEEGWPFPIRAAHEVTLINCPNLTIPADFRARDIISIHHGEIRVTVVFDGSVLVTISGAVIPHTLAQQMTGQPLSELVDIAQLRQHPVSAMTIETIDVVDDGLDIELR